MPIFIYQCQKCLKEQEIFQTSRTDLNPLCTEKNCKGITRKIISGTNFQLKGSGWYKDGYSSKKQEK